MGKVVLTPIPTCEMDRKSMFNGLVSAYEASKNGLYVHDPNPARQIVFDSLFNKPILAKLNRL